MSTKKISLCWKLITLKADNPKIAICDICKLQLVYNKRSTSNLLRHLRQKHPLELAAHRYEMDRAAGETASNSAPSQEPLLELEVESMGEEENEESLSMEIKDVRPLPITVTRTPTQPRQSQWKKKKDEFKTYRDACTLINLTRQAQAIPRPAPPPEDKFNLFAKHIEYKIRNLAVDQYIHAEKLINDVLYEAELGNLDREYRLSRNQQHNVIIPESHSMHAVSNTSYSNNTG